MRRRRSSGRAEHLDQPDRAEQECDRSPVEQDGWYRTGDQTRPVGLEVRDGVSDLVRLVTDVVVRVLAAEHAFDHRTGDEFELELILDVQEAEIGVLYGIVHHARVAR